MVVHFIGKYTQLQFGAKNDTKILITYELSGKCAELTETGRGKDIEAISTAICLPEE